VIHSRYDSTVQTVTSSNQQPQSSSTRSSSITDSHPSLPSVNDLPPPPPSLPNSICCAECPSKSATIHHSTQNTTLSHLRFQNRIDVDCETESNHDTALTLSCAGGHEELVTLLLQRGANIEHRDKKGFTPLILAGSLVYFFCIIKKSFVFHSYGWSC
jgi:ankyrin repeat protein